MSDKKDEEEIQKSSSDFSEEDDSEQSDSSETSDSGLDLEKNPDEKATADANEPQSTSTNSPKKRQYARKAISRTFFQEYLQSINKNRATARKATSMKPILASQYSPSNSDNESQPTVVKEIARDDEYEKESESDSEAESLGHQKKRIKQ